MVDTWIVLRGLSREAGHWGPFLPALRAAMPDAEILAIDLPGVGAHLHDRFPRSIHLAMESIRAEVAARATGGRRFVFGVSLGGMIVMEWAARHGAELAGVVVGASSASNLTPFWKRMRPRGILSVVRAAAARDPMARQSHIVQAVSNRRDLWSSTIREWADVERARPVTFGTVRAQLEAATRWRAPVSLQARALFLVGERDRLVHADCSRALAARYDAPLHFHPDAGHDLTTDATEWVTSELRTFGA